MPTSSTTATKAARTTGKARSSSRADLTGTTVDRTILNDWKIHPLADLFPLIADRELISLAEDIRDHGQSEPIWTLDGVLLDGRNRLVACHHVQVIPHIEEWKPKAGETAASFIVSRNLHRRHLTQSQRAALAVAMEKEIAAENRKQRRAAREAAQATFTSPAAKTAAPTTARPTQAPVTTPFTGNPGGPGARPVRPAAGRAREQAARALEVSTGYVADARNLADAYPDRFAEISSPTAPATIPRVQEDIVQEALDNAGVGPLDVGPGHKVLADVRLRPGATKGALTRLQQRAMKQDDHGRKKVTLRRSGQVTSSRVTVRVLATFGNTKAAEELLTVLNQDPRALEVLYEVVAEPKKITQERRRFTADS